MAKKRREITQEDILTWADGVSGVPAQDTAQKLGVHRNTITARRKKVAEFIAEKYDINEYRMGLFGLYSLWINSVIYNLKKNDVTMTVAFGKGLGILVDKQEIDGKGNFTGLSNDELAERVISRIKADASSKG